MLDLHEIFFQLRPYTERAKLKIISFVALSMSLCDQRKGSRRANDVRAVVQRRVRPVQSSVVVAVAVIIIIQNNNNNNNNILYTQW